MAVTKEEVQRIAQLAKLTFTEEEITTMQNELNTILHFMEKINSVNTEGVEPLTVPVPIAPVLRDDIVGKSLTPDEALKNAPASESPFFIVPKVIQGN